MSTIRIGTAVLESLSAVMVVSDAFVTGAIPALVVGILGLVPAASLVGGWLSASTEENACPCAGAGAV